VIQAERFSLTKAYQLPAGAIPVIMALYSCLVMTDEGTLLKCARAS
jgi:hypothetical protein